MAAVLKKRALAEYTTQVVSFIQIIHIYYYTLLFS